MSIKARLGWDFPTILLEYWCKPPSISSYRGWSWGFASPLVSRLTSCILIANLFPWRSLRSKQNTTGLGRIGLTITFLLLLRRPESMITRLLSLQTVSITILRWLFGNFLELISVLLCWVARPLHFEDAGLLGASGVAHRWIVALWRSLLCELVFPAVAGGVSLEFWLVWVI